SSRPLSGFFFSRPCPTTPATSPVSHSRAAARAFPLPTAAPGGSAPAGSASPPPWPLPLTATGHRQWEGCCVSLWREREGGRDRGEPAGMRNRGAWGLAAILAGAVLGAGGLLVASPYAVARRRDAVAALRGGALRGANLQRANLYGANLRRANLKGANLSRA